MFENPAKGWHGSYSVIGRSSAEKYHLILVKDLILRGRYKRSQIKNYFAVNKKQPKNKKKKEKFIDIFEEPSISDKIEKIHEYTLKRKKICEPRNLENVPERYKFHQNHHKELYNYNMILKQSKKYTPGSGKYNPKMEFIWKRTITGPRWDIISGRYKNTINLKDDIEIIKEKNKNIVRNRKEDKKEKDSLILDNNKIDKNNISDNINKKINDYFNPKSYGVPMIKQTRRGDLPISYDSRIRNDKPFQVKENNRNESNDFLKTIKFKSKNRDHNEPIKFKKPKKINKFLDFSKSLSREQYENMFKDTEIAPFKIPNYSQVEPRCLTMVSYSSKKAKKKMKKTLEGIDNSKFYDLDKVFNKINNHKEVSVPNFKMMVSRPNDQGPLPSYMINKFDRASLETITQKGLKMNGYSNVGFKTCSSSFYPKKSFNKVINYNLLNNDKFVDSNLDGLLEKMNNNKHIKKLIEIYGMNDNDEIESSINKFDAITYRTIHNDRKKRTHF